MTGQESITNLSTLIQEFEPGSRLIDARPLAGGVSAQTTEILVENASGERSRYVVRAHGSRDLARDPEIARHEYQLLAALRDAGLPVARPVWVHDASAGFDRAAIIVEYVEGEIVTDPPDPARHIAELAYWLARIHQFDLSSSDLGFLIARDFAASHRFALQAGDSRLVERICETLRAAGPVELTNQLVLLHGDYWRGNVLWEDGQLAAIIDWEDAMIGDPIQDLARSRLEIHLTDGPMARERFTSQYLSWRDIDVDNLAWWDLAMALGFARDFQGWSLPDEREREMEASLSEFARQAIEQLNVDRS